MLNRRSALLRRPPVAKSNPTTAAERLEATLYAHKGRPWQDYLRKKEGFIANVIEDNFKAGKRVTRAAAQQLWYARVERQLNNDSL